MKIFYSSCCGSATDDPLALEYGICPDCLERCEFEEEEEEEEFDNLCTSCNGSGEGMWDGSTCSSCKGSGTKTN